MQKVTIVIVNYNTKDVLRDCLTHLAGLSLPETKIVVVDNGSQDGSSTMVETEFIQVHLIKSENNGVAAGFNLALTQAETTDYYLFMGSDAFPQLGCIEGVVAFMTEHSKVGIATAKLVLRNGSLDMDAHRGFPTPWTALTHFANLDRLFSKSHIFNSYFLGGCNLEQPHEIDLCISHFMVVKKEVFTRIGKWDQDFFVYGEDVDLCWRAKQAGYQIYYLPQFECLHYKGVSVGTRKESADITKASTATKLRMKTESVRAMRLFYQKHLAKNYPWIITKIVESGISLMAKYRK